jgi:hypothetical protein
MGTLPDGGAVAVAKSGVSRPSSHAIRVVIVDGMELEHCAEAMLFGM